MPAYNAASAPDKRSALWWLKTKDISTRVLSWRFHAQGSSDPWIGWCKHAFNALFDW